jgi:TrmH family RNA methyltransferase
VAAVISSIKDEHLAQVRALATRAGRLAAGRCLLEGPALIGQALDAGARLRFAIRVEGAAGELGARLVAAGVPLRDVRDSVLRQVLRTPRPVGWVAVADLATERADASYGDFAVVLDRVLDPGNLGTIVRTALGLGVRDVVCTDPATDLSSRKVLDASRATVLRARVHRFDSARSAVLALRARGFEIVVTSAAGTATPAEARLRGGPVALVVGNETTGVQPGLAELADHVVRIPMSGEVESLNVGVATGICLHELRARALARSEVEPADGGPADELSAIGDAVRLLATWTSDARSAGKAAVERAAGDIALADFTESELARLTAFLDRIQHNITRGGGDATEN